MSLKKVFSKPSRNILIDLARCSTTCSSQRHNLRRQQSSLTQLFFDGRFQWAMALFAAMMALNLLAAQLHAQDPTATPNVAVEVKAAIPTSELQFPIG